MQHVTIWTARRSYVGSIRLSNAASRVLCCGSEMLQIAHKWHWRYRGDHGGGGAPKREPGTCFVAHSLVLSSNRCFERKRRDRGMLTAWRLQIVTFVSRFTQDRNCALYCLYFGNDVCTILPAVSLPLTWAGMFSAAMLYLLSIWSVNTWRSWCT